MELELSLTEPGEVSWIQRFGELDDDTILGTGMVLVLYAATRSNSKSKSNLGTPKFSGPSPRRLRFLPTLLQNRDLEGLKGLEVEDRMRTTVESFGIFFCSIYMYKYMTYSRSTCTCTNTTGSSTSNLAT